METIVDLVEYYNNGEECIQLCGVVQATEASKVDFLGFLKVSSNCEDVERYYGTFL